MRRLVVSLGAAILLLALPGCTAQVTEYAARTEIRDNRIGEITKAWRTPEGRLMVCATGWPSWHARDKAPVGFHFSAPLVRTLGTPRTSPHPGVDFIPIRRIAVAADAIAGGCPEQPQDLAAIASAPASTDRFGRLSPNRADRQDVAMLAEGESAMLWAVPVEGEPPAVAILYRHDEAIFDGARLAWVDTGSDEIYPNRAALVVLPFAVVADAAATVLVVGAVIAFAALAFVAAL